MALTNRFGATVAWLSIVTQLRLTAAATLTPPEDDSPDWLLPWLLPLEACRSRSAAIVELPPGSEFFVASLFLTWSFDCWSALLPPPELCCSPLALALTSVLAWICDEEAMVTKPPVVAMLRVVVPAVSMSTMLRPTIAPTATSPPAASASPLVVTVPS